MALPGQMPVEIYNKFYFPQMQGILFGLQKALIFQAIAAIVRKQIGKRLF